MAALPPLPINPSPGNNTPEIEIWVDGASVRWNAPPTMGTALSAMFPIKDRAALPAAWSDFKFTGFKAVDRDRKMVLCNFLGKTPASIKHPVLGINLVTVLVWFSPLRLSSMAPPTLNAALSTFTWVEDTWRTQYSTYIFKGFDTVTMDGAMRGVFVSPISSTLVRSISTTVEAHYWPEVLTALTQKHIERNGATWSNGGDPTQYSQWAILAKRIGAYHGLTRVTIEDYISSSIITSSATESLHPSRVSVNYIGPGGQFTMSEGLHDTITTLDQFEDGTANIIVPSRTFEATPQITWVNHVGKDGPPVFEDGYWFNRVITFIVPPNDPGES